MNDAFESLESFYVYFELFQIDLLDNSKVEVVLFSFKELIEIQNVWA